MAIADDLVASLNGHQITDDEGEMVENTTDQDTTSDEINAEDLTEEELPTAELSNEVSQPHEDEEESELAVDDSGRRYVPEKRFKDVYRKWKEAERSKTQAPTVNEEPEFSPNNLQVDKMERMENEFLFTRYPQFDPASSSYSPVLDKIAGDVYSASGGRMTKLEAARVAISRAKELADSEGAVKAGVRQVKMSQQESLSTRSGARATVVDPDKMSLSDMESYLKNTGNW